MEQNQTKICSLCRLEKEINEFYNSSSHADGKNPYCKRCKKSYNTIYYVTDAETQKNRIRSARAEQKRINVLKRLRGID